MSERIIVIGAGVTGMAAAALLAGEGRPVTLIEAAGSAGPLLRGFERGGFHFDTGFHFARGLEKGGPLRSWLMALGLELPWEELVPVTEIIGAEGRMLPYPVTMDDAAAFYPDSMQAFDAFCGEARRLRKASPFLSADSTNEYNPFAFASTPLAAYFERSGLSRDLRAALQCKCLLYGVPPAEAAAEDFFLVTGEGGAPSCAFPEGGKTLVEGFEKRLAGLGVIQLYGHAARCLKSARGVLQGVVLDNGEALEADAVIYTGNPRLLRSMLGQSPMRPAWFTHIESMPSTPAPLVEFGTCGADLPDHHAWYFMPSDGSFSSLDENEPVLCAITGASDDSGRKSCLIMALDGGRGGSPAGACFQRLPGLKNSWRSLGRWDGGAMRKFIHGSDGSSFGFAHAAGVTPVLPVTRLRGLFLAGQNILLPGILGCIVSAAIACGLILGVGTALRKFHICAAER